MKSIRKLLAGAAGLMVLMLAATPALATSDTTKAVSEHPVRRAEFTARGRGEVTVVNVNGAIDQDSIVVTGQGKVKIVDLAGDARIIVNGWRREPQSGNESVYKGRGRLAIRGTNVEITLEGRGHIWAKGDGQATLTGRGAYRLGSDRGHWSKEGVVVNF